MKKRILSCVLVLCLLCSLVPMAALAAGAEDFTDVATDAWYYDYVDYVAENGYYQGVGDSLFDPDGTMTRAMFVVVLSRIAGAELDNSTSTFEDVPADQWYTGAVAWAVEAGITNGTSSTTFSPDSAVTRQDMCVFMDRFIDWYEGENTTTTKKTEHQDDTQLIDAFGDAADIASYATSSVEACRVYGLVEGYQDGNFYPLLASTRAEIAAVIYRLTWKETAISTGGGSNSGSPPSTTYTVTYYDFGVTEQGVTTYAEIGTSTGRTSFEAKSYTDTTGNFKDTYEFTGWLDKDSGIVYAAGEVYPISSDIDLYAQGYNKTDYIALGLSGAMATINENNEAAYSDSALTIDKLVLAADPADDENVTRQQTVNITATLGSGTATELVGYITGAVVTLLGVNDSTNTVTTDDLRTLVNTVATEFGFSLSGVAVSDIVTTVQDTILTNSKGLWTDNFYENGYCYSGDIEIAVGSSYSVTITVDDSGAHLATGTAAQTALELGTALAKAMYTDLKSTAATADYNSTVTMSATLDVTFSDSMVANNPYADSTAHFPHEYPFTISVTMEDETGTVAYKYYNGMDYIKVYASNYLDEYTSTLEQAVKGVLNNTGVTNYMLNIVLTNYGSYITQIAEVLKDDIEQESGGLVSPNIADIEGILQDWLTTNFNTLLLQYYDTGDLAGVVTDNSVFDDYSQVIDVNDKIENDIIPTLELALGFSVLDDLYDLTNDPMNVTVDDIRNLLSDSTIQLAFNRSVPATLKTAVANITISGKVSIESVSGDDYGYIDMDTLKAAVGESDICTALLDALSNITNGDLKLSSFAADDGANVTLAVGNRTHTVNLVIA
ncbi:MAG: S-layer homology domain-containing protein [Oscillospiraceae bacterium]|nr:S-layer homology domain-containing protein [Oscillospiraceae bacterium]